MLSLHFLIQKVGVATVTSELHRSDETWRNSHCDHGKPWKLGKWCIVCVVKLKLLKGETVNGF